MSGSTVLNEMDVHFVHRHNDCLAAASNLQDISDRGANQVSSWGGDNWTKFAISRVWGYDFFVSINQFENQHRL